VRTSRSDISIAASTIHAFRGELASWIRDERAGDGMPTHGVPLSEVGEPLQAFFRTSDSGGNVAEGERELALGSPLLTVIGAQALANVLLTACALDLSASFLNQPIQVPSHRPLVAESIGCGGHPQLLLRLGYGPPARPTARRTLQDLVL
jgi:hypothetical protein